MTEQLIVRFTTVTGKPANLTTLYTVNQRNWPFFSEWRQVAPGELAVRYPKEQPFGLAALWDVPGFGRIITTADNEGQFYRLGQGQVLDFRAEATRSKVARVTQRLASFKAGGTAFTQAIERKIADLTPRLAAALAVPAGEPAARALDAVLCAAFWAGEELELAKARADIDRMPAQERRAKLFGASFFEPDAPETFMVRYEQLFNFATLPFYRRQVEPVEGHPDWATRDRLLDWVDQRAMQRKGHPLSWWIEHGLTDWMKRLSYKTLKEVIYQQVFDTVTRYRDRIRIWDVINEAHDPIVKGNDLNLNEEQVYEITALACKATHDADPTSTRIVNINRPFGVYRSEWEMMDPIHAVEYLEELGRRGIDFEVVGVQAYHAGPEHYVHDMADQSAMLDQYIALGKPVHISEVQTPSSMEAEPLKWLGGRVAPSGWWHRPWDPEVQADWVEQFYTIATSKAQIGAITWWNLSDQRSFWPHGGLLDAQNLPKPAYHRLKAFIQELRGE
jgi:GH35 family endo-1,4-beta-xylanase